jgi:outer membrane immunogenic protein
MLKKVMFIAISCWLSNFTFAGGMGGFHDDSLEGVYVGVGTGLLNLSTDDNFIARKSNSSINVNETEKQAYTSILFTGNVGYGRMYTDTIYIGAKANIIYSPFSFVENDSYTVPNGSSTIFGYNTYTTQIRPFYNLDAVLGYEFIPNFIPFVEGGLTFANVNKKYVLKRTVNDYLNNTSSQYGFTVNANNYSTGYNVGLGLNYHAQSHWIVSGELLYIDLGENFGTSGAQIPGTAIFDSQSRRLNSSAIALLATVSYLI